MNSDSIAANMPASGYSVITINRQYAAKGRTLAAEISRRLGIPYYDKDFVLRTAEESGYDPDLVSEESEELSTSGKILDSILNSTVSYKSSHDEIFKAEKEVILKLSKTPCIIVGRCANHVLKEHGIPVLSVFLHGSLDARRKHAEELAENGNMPLDKYIEARDKKRNNFYKKYTGKDINEASNYTISLDTGLIDVNVCADIVERLYRDSLKG
jgi:cytidylate kinase